MEFLAALVVMGLLVLLALWSLQRLQRSRHNVAVWSQTMDEARYILRLIEGDLRNVYRGDYEGDDYVRFSTRETAVADTVFGPAFYITQPDSRLTREDIVRVSYDLSPLREGEKMRLFTRFRQTEETAGPVLTAADGTLQIWVTLNELNFSYYDGENWLTNWRDKTTLPDAVKVELIYSGDKLAPDGWRITKTISLHPLRNLVE